jgi:hypothetical protein
MVFENDTQKRGHPVVVYLQLNLNAELFPYCPLIYNHLRMYMMHEYEESFWLNLKLHLDINTEMEFYSICHSLISRNIFYSKII